MSCVLEEGDGATPQFSAVASDDAGKSHNNPIATTSYDEVKPMTREEKIMLFDIAVSCFLPQAALSAFRGLTPALLTILVGNAQHAGTLSACAAGVGSLVALFATPVMSQLMDVYGRRLFAVLGALKALIITLPMVVGGYLVHENRGGMHGENLAGGALHSFQLCVALWFVASFVKTATTTSQGAVVVGDLFKSAHHRAIGIGIYQACLTGGTFAAFLGASLPLYEGSLCVLMLSVGGVVYSYLFFPEPPAPRQSDSRHLHQDNTMCSGGEDTVGLRVQSRCSSPTSPSPLRLCVSPLDGLKPIKGDRPAVIAVLIIGCFIFSEITAGDVMGFYLSKKLHFTPWDLSFVGVEMTVIQIVASVALVPVISRVCTTSTVAMLSSVLIAASMVLIAFATTKFMVFLAMALCALAIIAMPALVAIVMRSVKTPSDVSGVVNSLMAINFALSAGGGVGGGLLFSILPSSVLFLTFIFVAVFTIPMFVLSYRLRGLLLSEDDGDQKYDA